MNEAVPWGIHRIGDLYSANAQAGLPDGRWVQAVCVPYDGYRLRAAWWILTGRAYAFVWPKAGDLEALWARTHPVRAALDKDTPK
jgi:hypothetical protein